MRFMPGCCCGDFNYKYVCGACRLEAGSRQPVIYLHWNGRNDAGLVDNSGAPLPNPIPLSFMGWFALPAPGDPNVPFWGSARYSCQGINTAIPGYSSGYFGPPDLQTPYCGGRFLFTCDSIYFTDVFGTIPIDHPSFFNIQGGNQARPITPLVHGYPMGVVGTKPNPSNSHVLSPKEAVLDISTASALGWPHPDWMFFRPHFAVCYPNAIYPFDPTTIFQTPTGAFETGLALGQYIMSSPSGTPYPYPELPFIPSWETGDFIGGGNTWRFPCRFVNPLRIGRISVSTSPGPLGVECSGIGTEAPSLIATITGKTGCFANLPSIVSFHPIGVGGLTLLDYQEFHYWEANVGPCCGAAPLVLRIWPRHGVLTLQIGEYFLDTGGITATPPGFLGPEPVGVMISSNSTCNPISAVFQIKNTYLPLDSCIITVVEA